MTKKELYAEVRQLTLAHQGGESDSLGRPTPCSYCESRWRQIEAVLDKIVDNAEEILDDTLVEEAKAEELRRRIAALKPVKLRPRRT